MRAYIRHLLHRRLAAGTVTLLALAGLALASLALPAGASAAATKVVRYGRYRLVVPASWPVYRLQEAPSTCVRFDRHAVYLGRPSAAERCPATLAAGRTEAVLVEPLGAGDSGAGAGAPALPMTSTRAAMPGAGSAAQIVDSTRGVVVTATWHQRPAVIAHALGLRSLAGAVAHSVRRRAAAPTARRYAPTLRHARFRARAATAPAATGPAAPGQVYTGPAFDACHTPSASQMTAWGSSPYRALGVYIGGAEMACSQPNLTASWVSAQSAAGWHLIPIYVGYQAPSNSCGCSSFTTSTASSYGVAAANDAVADAQAIGIGTGNPLYFDLEAYSRNSTSTAAVLSFVSAWTTQLHADGYASGVYVADNSGVVDLGSQYGTGYAEPDEIWIANWNNQADTADYNIPATDWPNHQRLHQYDGAHNETYGGTTINIDGDYVDASTAAAGSGSGVQPALTPAPAPTLSLTPGPDGTLAALPAWQYETGIASWQLLGGQSPSSLTPVAAPTATTPIVSDNAFNYFAVSAIAANGQILGSSAPVATPPHVAIYGAGVFVPAHGLAGIPVGCVNPQACWITTTIALGNSLLARTGHEKVAPGGGLVYFGLGAYQHKLLNHAAHHSLPVTITIRDASGMSATRTLTLNGFSTRGRSPARSMSRSVVHLVGTSDFVSHGWVGGILAGCFDSIPCQASTTIVAAGQVIARTHAQTLGVGELGYLMFTMTRAGHTMLLHAPGNQLGVSVTIKTPRRTERGHIVLSAY